MNEANEVTRDWLENADDDWKAMQAVLSLDPPLLRVATFHAQQSAEKLMKALLIEAGKLVPKSHNLAVLSEMISEVHPAWLWDAGELITLTRGAVELRYPDFALTEDQAREAVDICGRLRPALLALLEGKDDVEGEVDG